jgi:uncharacterized integral membrane protein
MLKITLILFVVGIILMHYEDKERMRKYDAYVQRLRDE